MTTVTTELLDTTILCVGERVDGYELLLLPQSTEQQYIGYMKERFTVPEESLEMYNIHKRQRLV